jgi:uncharacterized OB-fold protein
MASVSALGVPKDTDAGKPVPEPSAEAAEFWAAANREELWVQRCVTTGRPLLLPADVFAVRLRRAGRVGAVSGRATLYSYILDQRPAPGFGPGPNIIAVVELARGHG